MALNVAAALWFLPIVLPICFFVAYSDLARMRIPNLAVLALLAWFALVGPLALPLDQYLAQWLHIAVALPVGMALFALRIMGAGDAKFIMAAAGYIARDDLALVLALLSACLLAGLVTHRAARRSPLRSWAPDWTSWATTRHFPMGLPLAGTLALYLVLAVIGL